MLFSEQRFLFFFVAVFLVCWSLPSNRWRKLFLLVCSYLFYAGWDWRLTPLILFSTVMDYALALRITGAQEKRKRWLVISLIANLGLLGFFKYYNFFVAEAASFTAWLGVPVSVPTLEIILPVGISFYTFESLSYTIDVYRGLLAPVRNFTDFALFIAFFPKLVAGPIMRAKDFLPQLFTRRRLTDVNVRACLTLFLIGYFKKTVVSDHVAAVIDPIFANPQLFAAPDLWLGAVLYSLQLYCDFSGYSDMALATAGLLGYRLTLNFDAPYLSQSVREFWTRWHISLSSWFRDYLYIPLGGNRGTRSRTAFNLFMVFLLCGIWHGAKWTFVAFGLIHGLFLSLERFVDVGRMPRPLRHAYTLFVVCIGFTVFRTTDMPTFVTMLRGMFAPLVEPALWSSGEILPLWWLVPVVFVLAQAADKRLHLARAASRVPGWRFAVLYGVAVALTLPWVAIGYRPFIYFQF